MEKVPKEMLKACVDSQKFSSTIQESSKRRFFAYCALCEFCDSPLSTRGSRAPCYPPERVCG